MPNESWPHATQHKTGRPTAWGNARREQASKQLQKYGLAGYFFSITRHMGGRHAKHNSSDKKKKKTVNCPDDGLRAGDGMTIIERKQACVVGRA